MTSPAVAPADSLDPDVLLSVLAEIKGGDFTARMPPDVTGVADELNDVIVALQALEAELRRVSHSSNSKSEFIADMSHDMRTPLSSLLMLAEQLEDNPDENLTDTQVEYASVILDCGRDLLRLLDDLSELARVESGTVKIEMTDVPMTALCDLLLREFKPLAGAKGWCSGSTSPPESPKRSSPTPNVCAKFSGASWPMPSSRRRGVR